MSGMIEGHARKAVDPRRYFESVETRHFEPEQAPVCLYLETTNRCNLLCTTCPRTYAELEPPADMSWELFTSIVEQVPNLARVPLDHAAHSTAPSNAGSSASRRARSLVCRRDDMSFAVWSAR